MKYLGNGLYFFTQEEIIDDQLDGVPRIPIKPLTSLQAFFGL